jgi:hypothetical protein
MSEDGELLPYFGYGTLLGAGHMRERYLSAEPLGLAFWEGHQLDFLRYESAERGGCSIAAKPEGILFGVLYRLSRADMDRLMAVGGDAEWYDAPVIEVTRVTGGRMRAVTLRVNGERGPWAPPAAYAKLIIDGAAEAGLPAEYRALLDEIVAAAQAGG